MGISICEPIDSQLLSVDTSVCKTLSGVQVRTPTRCGIHHIDNACTSKHDPHMTKLSTAKRVQVINALVEGVSVRATSRMTGVAKGTILRLLADLGAVCREYHDEHAWREGEADSVR
jgi:hypothetical protein